MNPTKYLTLLLSALLWLCPPAHAMQAPETGPLILAVHPYLLPGELIRRFTPLAHHLGDRLGRKVLVRVGKDYTEHEEHIGRNQVDIAFMGPAPYVRMTELYGPKPLLARLEIRGQPVFRGLIGPMPDGKNVIRYESPEVFETLTKEWDTKTTPRRTRTRERSAR